MPRTADHDARRRQICDAVREVAVTDGLGTVTIARTATRAGVSVGLVQHYYATKDDLIADVHAQVRHDIEARITRAVAVAEARFERIEQILGDALQQMLPLDDARRAECQLYVAFAALALDEPRLRPGVRETEHRLSERIVQAVENGKECGEVHAVTDADLAGQSLAALTLGLMTRGLLDEAPRAEAVLRSALAAIFPGECARSKTPRHPGE